VSIRHYDIDLAITPHLGEIRARARCRYVAGERTKSIEFVLHRNLKIDELSGAGVASFTVEPTCTFPFTPEAATVRVDMDQWVEQGSSIDLTVSYSGTMAKVPEAWGTNCVTDQWVELGMYGPWFPWQPSVMATFTYSVDFQVPSGFEVAGLGRVERTVRGPRLTSTRPQSDIVVVAAPGLHSISAADERVRAEVHFGGEASQDAEAAANIASETLWVLKYYRGWLADDSEQTGSASVILSPRQMGGGYARPGLVVLSNISTLVARPLAVFKFLAHEFAHLWWVGAPVDTWEDWLNEGFAEYFSLRAVRQRFGEEALGEIVQKKRERIQGLPPVRGVVVIAEPA
jgi:hypothetical protein